MARTSRPSEQLIDSGVGSACWWAVSDPKSNDTHSLVLNRWRNPRGA